VSVWPVSFLSAFILATVSSRLALKIDNLHKAKSMACATTAKAKNDPAKKAVEPIAREIFKTEDDVQLHKLPIKALGRILDFLEDTQEKPRTSTDIECRKDDEHMKMGESFHHLNLKDT
jgi:predicted transcriptional regulator